MLSTEAKKAIKNAIADPRLGDEVSDAIDSNGSGPAANVSDIGSTTDIPASNAVLSTSDTYTDADVKTAIDGAIDAQSSAVEARLDVIEAKIDEILAAFQASGQMS